MQDLFEGAFEEASEDQEPQVTEAHTSTDEQLAPAEPEVEQAQLTDEQPQEAEVVQADEEEKKSRRDHPIPLPTFLDMRDRAKAAEAAQKQAAAEASQLRQELEQLRNPNSVYDASDPVSDPEGFNRLLEQRIQQGLFNERMVSSHARARAAHDAETVEAAVEWATTRTASDTAFDQLIQRQADPIEWVIQQHRAAQSIEDFQRDPDDYVRRRAAELGLGQLTTQATSSLNTNQARAERVQPRSITGIAGSNKTSNSKISTDQEDYLPHLR